MYTSHISRYDCLFISFARASKNYSFLGIQKTTLDFPDNIFYVFVIPEIERNREFYRTTDVRPPFTYASLIRQVLFYFVNNIIL